MGEFKKNERVGSVNFTKDGYKMTVIDYINANNVIVEFEDEWKAKVHCSWKNFESRKVKNPYAKSVYGIAAIGQKYPSWVDGRHTKEYRCWIDMIERCYSEKQRNKNITYEHCSVCKEWLIYENFYEWIIKEENYLYWKNNNRWCLDKDILVIGNEIYSPDTCCLVPEIININFRTYQKGKYGFGITMSNDKYVAQCSIRMNGKKKNNYLGRFDTKEEAMVSYKTFKESYIKELANKYKNVLSKTCYNALMNYEVEITD